MKKFFTKLLVVSIICSIIIFILCFIATFTTNFDFLATKKVVDEVNKAGGNTPGIGEYLLIMGGFALMLDVSAGVLLLFITLINPSFILIAIILSQSISRLFQIGSEKKWKNINSKIFTYVSLVLQFLLCSRLLLLLRLDFIINNVPILIALFINIFCIIFFIYTLIRLKKYELCQ